MQYVQLIGVFGSRRAHFLVKLLLQLEHSLCTKCNNELKYKIAGNSNAPPNAHECINNVFGRIDSFFVVSFLRIFYVRRLQHFGISSCEIELNTNVKIFHKSHQDVLKMDTHTHIKQHAFFNGLNYK